MTGSMSPGRRSTPPLTLALWSMLRGRSRADRMLVFRALAGGTTVLGDARAQLAVNALWLCSADVGGPPSWRQYEAWRTSQDAAREWPTVSQLRSIFGTWAQALTACGYDPAPDVLAQQLAGLGGPFDAAELINNLQLCAQALHRDDFSFNIYKKWAAEELRKPEELRCRWRLCFSQNTFVKHFGSWPKARLAAGLGANPQGQALMRATRGVAGDYEGDRLLALLQRAAAETGLDGRLTPGKYDVWAREASAASLAGGHHVGIARSVASSKRYDGWAQALRAAELLTDDELRRRRHTRPHPWEDQELLEALKQAHAALGDRLNRSTYEKWREELLQSDNAPANGVPSRTIIQRRLGWNDTVAAVREA